MWSDMADGRCEGCGKHLRADSEAGLGVLMWGHHVDGFNDLTGYGDDCRTFVVLEGDVPVARRAYAQMCLVAEERILSLEMVGA